MKVIYKMKIGIYTIVFNVVDAVTDPEATKKKVDQFVKPEMTDKEYEDLFNANLVYATVGPEADMVSDEEGAEIQRKINEAGKHRKLLASGGYVVDHRCCEYWIVRDGKWVKEKIAEIGIDLPEGAVLQEDLTAEQREVIAGQQEAERIAVMSTEEKEKAKQNALDALADEADRLARRATIQKKTLDPAAWYSERADAIEAKYA